MMFEIFTQKNIEEGMSTDIDTLYGYPKDGTTYQGKKTPNIRTERYRDVFKHPTEELWAAPVDMDLEDKCKDMTEPEREKYYISTDLKDFQYLLDNKWFPEPDIGE